MGTETEVGGSASAGNGTWCWLRLTSEFLHVSESVPLGSRVNASQARRAPFLGKFIFELPLSFFQVDDLEVALKELETHLGFPLQGFVPYTCSVRPTVEIPKDRLQKYLENVFSEQATGSAALFALQPERSRILEPLALSVIWQMD